LILISVQLSIYSPNTNGSQFFILYDAQPFLNNVNTVFGRIIHGMEVLDSMERIPTDAKDRPTNEIKILNITIHANPCAD
jgi:peptidyl-prolyl cis-trans isomerase-like 3